MLSTRGMVFFVGLLGILGLNHHQGVCAENPHPIEIERPVARPSVGPNGAVFMTFLNHKPGPDRLVAVSCEICMVTEIHDHVQEGPADHPRWKMRPIPFLELPAAGIQPIPVRLESGGKHIMLLGIKKPLKIGERVPIKLYFQNAEPVTVDVLITPDVPVAPHKHAS